MQKKRVGMARWLVMTEQVFLILQQDAEKKGEKRWHIVHKHHFAQHLAEQFRYLNNKYGWTFKTEDYVGRLATLGHSCTFGTSALNQSIKIVDKWLIMFHMRLSRDILGVDP